MEHHDVVIVGGGLAGLSLGCYARMSGLSTLVVEHNAELGGMCTAWPRDRYLIDGCIHWLMGGGEGGTFRTMYEELGIVPKVPLRRLDLLNRFEHPTEGWTVEMSADLSRMHAQMLEVGREDAGELERFFEAVAHLGEMPMPLDAPELEGIGHRLERFWEMRDLAAPLLQFRGSLGEWRRKHLRAPRLSRLFGRLLMDDMPMIFLPFLISQLHRGQLSRPEGGSGRFRDAIVDRYHELGGTTRKGVRVEEILVENDRARGVLLADGTEVRARQVVSTAGAHETLLRMLGGRYLDAAWTKRLDAWPTFDPIVLFSAGVATPLHDAPHSITVMQAEPLDIGGHESDALYLRIYNDDPAFAPPGHTVVQTMLPTTWGFWAGAGDRYASEKAAVVERILARIEQRLPEVRGAVRMTDIATPLTYYRHARTWRGAYEGWLPTQATFSRHVPKAVPGLSNMWLAGQWVEPGGGVPTALLSGRHAAQLVCDALHQPFTATSPRARAS